MFNVSIGSKDMHLAAYMKANGAELQSVTDNKFNFITDMKESDWRVKHSNSCCRVVDNELLSLRRML